MVKKIMNEPQNIVDEMLEGFVFAHEEIEWFPNYRVVALKEKKKGKVGIMSVGGSGHEPAHRYQRGHGDHRSHHAHRSRCGLYDRDPGHAAGRLCGRKRQSAGVSHQGGGHCGGRRSWNDYDRGISLMIVQVISAFFAILGFSVVNNVPKKILLY